MPILHWIAARFSRLETQCEPPKNYYPGSFVEKDFSLLCQGLICEKDYHVVKSKTYMWINILEISPPLPCFLYFLHLP